MRNVSLLHGTKPAFMRLINDVMQIFTNDKTQRCAVVPLLNEQVANYIVSEQQMPDYRAIIDNFANEMGLSNRSRFQNAAQSWLDARVSLWDSLEAKRAVFPDKKTIEEYLTSHFAFIKTILLLRDENEFLFDDELTRNFLRSVFYADSEFSDDNRLWKHSLYSPYCLNLLYEVYGILESYHDFINSTDAKPFITVPGILSSFGKVLVAKITNLFSCQCFDNHLEYFVELDERDEISTDSFLVGKIRPPEYSVHSVEIIRLGEKLIEFYTDLPSENDKYKALIIANPNACETSLEILHEMQFVVDSGKNESAVIKISDVWEIKTLLTDDIGSRSFSQIAQHAANEFNAVFYLDNVGLYKNMQQEYNISFDKFFTDMPNSYTLLAGDGFGAQSNDYARTLLFASAILNGLSAGSLLLYKKVFDYSKLKHIASFQNGSDIKNQRLYFYSSVIPKLSDNELIKTYLSPASKVFVCREEMYDCVPMTILAVDKNSGKNKDNSKYKIERNDKKRICISAWQVIKGLHSYLPDWHDLFQNILGEQPDAESYNKLISELRNISLEILYSAAGADIHVNVVVGNTDENNAFQEKIAAFLRAFVRIAYDYRESSSMMKCTVSTAKDLMFDDFAHVFQAALSGRCKNFNDILFFELLQSNRRALPAKITVSTDEIKRVEEHYRPILKKDRKYLQMMIRTMSTPRMSTTDELSARRLCLFPGADEAKFDLFSSKCELEYNKDLESIAKACVNLGYSQSNICRNTGVRV